MVDALRQRQERCLKLGHNPRSLVDQGLQLGKTRMAGICAVVDQIGLAALFDHACAQQREDLAPQAAGAQPGETGELAEIERALGQHE